MAITGAAKALFYAGLCAFVLGGLGAMLPLEVAAPVLGVDSTADLLDRIDRRLRC